MALNVQASRCFKLKDGKVASWITAQNVCSPRGICGARGGMVLTDLTFSGNITPRLTGSSPVSHRAERYAVNGP